MTIRFNNLARIRRDMRKGAMDAAVEIAEAMAGTLGDTAPVGARGDLAGRIEVVPEPKKRRAVIVMGAAPQGGGPPLWILITYGTASGGWRSTPTAADPFIARAAAKHQPRLGTQVANMLRGLR